MWHIPESEDDEENMIHLTLRLPKPLIEEIDSLVTVHHFANRQEALREAIREFVNAKRQRA